MLSGIDACTKDSYNIGKIFLNKPWRMLLDPSFFGQFRRGLVLKFDWYVASLSNFFDIKKLPHAYNQRFCYSICFGRDVSLVVFQRKPRVKLLFPRDFVAMFDSGTNSHPGAI